ncbi:MAG: AAA family ATPase [Planctomycetia bacterium]|nr:AAA family ATPase [Planctomycetia bacterium]
MRITSLDIEQFGIWDRLSLPKVSRGLNVFYGPNEAGKTTLMQFIRSGLYGCANEERAKYIQMVLEGSGPAENSFLLADGKDPSHADQDEKRWVGGSLCLSTEYGRYRLDRRYLRRSGSLYSKQTALEMKSGFIATGGLANWSGRFYPIPGKGIAESLIVSGPDGARLSDYFVQTLVNNVDEATFNNVFAIGLDELQKLGTLSETDAAQMLYRLSVGVDRISLIQVLHQIVDERNEILDIQGKPTILEGLLDQKERLNQKAGESVFHLNEYARILTEQREVQEAIRQLKEKIDQNTQKQRLYELSLSIAPLWDSRAVVRNEISAMGSVAVIEQDALDEVSLHQDTITEIRNSYRNLHGDYLNLKKKLNAILLEKTYLDMAPRIEWLQEEIPHLQKIDADLAALQKEKNEIDNQLDQEELRLRGARNGKIFLTHNALDTLQERKSDASLPITDPSVSDKDAAAWETGFREVEDYRVPAKAIHKARKHYSKTKEQHTQVEARLASIAEKLDSGLSSRGQRNLTEALENTSTLVSALRRRVEIGQRLQEMDQYRKELERLNTYLAANQSLQTGPLIAVAAGIIAGLFLCGYAFMQKDPGVGILGMLLAIFCFIFKTSAEKKNFAKLEENQQQLGSLLKQIERTKEEAQTIDSQFPAAGQTADIRLQKAQADLVWFEKMVPLDSQWKETHHHLQTLETRKDKAGIAVKSAHKRWRHWLKIAELPLTLKPVQIKEMLERVDIAEDLRQRSATLQTELNFLLRERQGLEDHVERVLAGTGYLKKEDQSTIDIIEDLGKKLTLVRSALKDKKDLEKSRIQLLRQRKKILSKIRFQKRELHDFLGIFGLASPDDLIKARNRYLDYTQKMERAADLDTKVSAGIGNFCEESAISELLDDTEVRASIPTLQEKVRVRLISLQSDFQEKSELSGRLGEQLSALAVKKDAVRFQFNRAATDLRIQEMGTLWQSRSVACRMMEDIRKAYERERQPETLREASAFLNTLTMGQYVKIWTPLGENVLYVDTAQGKTLDVADLSRGTREQLFIAIRLALTTTFEKHGVQLPLILDDVLVNFDNQRALAAARLLHGFAKTGHQVFLFTCHEHICRIFLGLDTPIHVLPAVADQPKKFKILLPPSLSPEKKPKPLPEKKKDTAITIPVEPYKEKPVPVKKFKVYRIDPQRSFSDPSLIIRPKYQVEKNGKLFRKYYIGRSVLEDFNPVPTNVEFQNPPEEVGKDPDPIAVKRPGPPVRRFVLQPKEEETKIFIDNQGKILEQNLENKDQEILIQPNIKHLLEPVKTELGIDGRQNPSISITAQNPGQLNKEPEPVNSDRTTNFSFPEETETIPAIEIGAMPVLPTDADQEEENPTVRAILDIAADNSSRPAGSVLQEEYAHLDIDDSSDDLFNPPEPEPEDPIKELKDHIAPKAEEPEDDSDDEDEGADSVFEYYREGEETEDPGEEEEEEAEEGAPDDENSDDEEEYEEEESDEEEDEYDSDEFEDDEE